MPNWSLSRSAAIDVKVINPLNLQFLQKRLKPLVMQLTEKRSSNLEIIRQAPLEDGHASLQLVVEVFGGCAGWAMKLSMCFQP